MKIATHTAEYDPSIVNLPHAVYFRALYGANLVTLPSKFGRNETLALHRVDRREHKNAAASPHY